MILFYAFYNALGVIALYFKDYETALFLFSSVPLVFIAYELLRAFQRYINTNQFTDGQHAAIEQYNEDTKQ